MEFQTFAERIGVVPKRAAAIIDLYLSQYDRVKVLTENSFLNKESKEIYLKMFADKLSRMQQSNKLV